LENWMQEETLVNETVDETVKAKRVRKPKNAPVPVEAVNVEPVADDIVTFDSDAPRRSTADITAEVAQRKLDALRAVHRMIREENRKRVNAEALAGRVAKRRRKDMLERESRKRNRR
jgi:hypothetical protein